MKHELSAMILAAGLGTRLKALTHDKPKALVELDGKPMLQHCIENLIANDFHNIVINVHHFGDQIIEFVEHNKFDADITISDERKQLLDTGGGIVKATPLFKKSKAVLVHNVDIICNVNLKETCIQFIDSEDDAWLFTTNRETNRKLLFDAQNQLIGWMNKEARQFKWTDEAAVAHHLMRQAYKQKNQSLPYFDFKEMAFSGLHVFRGGLFAEFKCKPQSVIDLYLILARKNRIISKPIHPDFWFDIGKPEQLDNAENFLKQQTK